MIAVHKTVDIAIGPTKGRANEPVRFHFSTAVWGPWHTGVFLDVNLPSLLAPGNLPTFCNHHEVTYRIFTSKNDAKRITSSVAFKQAAKFVRFEILPVPVERAVDPIAMHHVLWRRSINDARAAGAMVLFVPPDVIWSDGSFASVAQLVNRGKRAIFMTYMRVVSETCIPEMKELYLSQDGAQLRASSAELVAAMNRHIHPLTLTYLNDSSNFPIHPELVLWRLPGQGYLMRVLVREMFCYDPRLIGLNEQALPAQKLVPELVHFITDSDELFSLSLTPALKDLTWYVEPQRLNALKIASWWLRYDSPANDQVAALTFRIHGESVDWAAWRCAEIESKALIERLRGTREILRVIGALPPGRHTNLSQILAALLATSRIARALPVDGPVTVFLPNDTAVLERLFDDGEALLKTPGRRALIGLIRNHIVRGRIRLQPGRALAMMTIGGHKRYLTWHGGRPLLDGVPFSMPGLSLGRYWGYVLDGMLPPAATTFLDVSTLRQPENFQTKICQ